MCSRACLGIAAILQHCLTGGGSGKYRRLNDGGSLGVAVHTRGGTRCESSSSCNKHLFQLDATLSEHDPFST